MRRADSKPAQTSAPTPKLTLVAVPKIPGISVFDLCWKRFAGEVEECFDENWHRHEEYLGLTGAKLLPKDQLQLNDLRAAFDKIKLEHRAAAQSMNIGRARQKARFLRSKCVEFKDTTKASCRRAKEHQVLAAGYVEIEERAKPLSLIEYRYSGPTPPDIPRCKLGLRIDTTRGLARWFRDEHRRPIHLIKGGKGSGKSTLLHSLAELCADENRPVLGASYVFTEALTASDFHQRFVATMVDEVTKYAPDLKDAVCAIKPQKDDFRLKSIKHQTVKIFVKVCEAAFQFEDLESGNHGSTNFVIMFDGLDDCNQTILQGVFDFISETIKALPWVHFIIASRYAREVEEIARGNGLENWIEVTEIGDYRLLLRAYVEEYRQRNPP